MYIGIIILILMILPKISQLFEGYEKKVRDERQDVGLMVDKGLIGPSPVNKRQ